MSFKLQALNSNASVQFIVLMDSATALYSRLEKKSRQGGVTLQTASHFQQRFYAAIQSEMALA